MLRLDAGPGGDFHGSLELGASFVAEQPAARRAAPLCVDGFGLCLELHAFLSHLKKINEEITVFIVMIVLPVFYMLLIGYSLGSICLQQQP